MAVLTTANTTADASTVRRLAILRLCQARSSGTFQEIPRIYNYILLKLHNIQSIFKILLNYYFLLHSRATPGTWTSRETYQLSYVTTRSTSEPHGDGGKGSDTAPDMHRVLHRPGTRAAPGRCLDAGPCHRRSWWHHPGPCHCHWGRRSTSQRLVWRALPLPAAT